MRAFTDYLQTHPYCQPVIFPYLVATAVDGCCTLWMVLLCCCLWWRLWHLQAQRRPSLSQRGWDSAIAGLNGDWADAGQRFAALDQHIRQLYHLPPLSTVTTGAWRINRPLVNMHD